MRKKYKNTGEIAKEFTDKKPKQYGFSDVKSTAKKNIRREVGDVWIVKDPTSGVEVIWEQKNGYRVKKGKNSDIFQELRKYQTTFINCPKDVCTCTNPNSLDKKLRPISGMCADCHFENETKMIIDGTFDTFSEKTIKNNVKAYLRDAASDVQILKDSLEKITFMDEDGGSETWTFESKKAYFKKIDDDFAQYKKNMLIAYELTEDELD